MKFFTPEWHSGELSDDEWGAIPSRYQSHLESLLPGLPKRLQDLITDVDLHDGLIQRVEMNRGACKLSVTLCCGDLQVGYSDVTLRYSGADLNRLSTESFRNLAGAELLSDEIDAEGEMLVHRVLFWSGCDSAHGPYQEVSIRFTDLDHHRAGRTDRSTDPSQFRFVEII